MLRLEHTLIPWNRYFIMPVFALANAGVALGGDAARSIVTPVGLGVICGLVAGKPVGIILFSWLATRSRLAAMLDGIGWRQIAGVGTLAGIGFTMSLFVAHLAFGETPALETAKTGVLAASVISGFAGTLVLLKTRPSRGAAES
jgi:Na+:H+ antiporter, NhaA family